MNRRGIKFGELHSGNDWNIILHSKLQLPPKPKESYVSVDGRDGDIDLSDALTGEIKYENRTLKYEFIMTNGTYLDREDLIMDILKAVHGKKLMIITDDDKHRYFYGRCSVEKVKNTNAYCELTIEATCDPWRFNVLETIRTIAVDSKTIELPCVNLGAKTVVPELVVEGAVNIEYDSTSVALTTGTYKIASLRFKTGTKILTVSGSGTLTVKYREAFL